jgi:elongation factor Ts
MAITAQEVNDLRALTGAGMMDCKKALTEAEGNVEKAIEILRKKGQKISDSRKDREAKEGAIFALVAPNGGGAVMLELNCETDFVGRNDDFQQMGQKFVAQALASKPADLAALNAMEVEGKTVEIWCTEAMAKIGEKIAVSKYEYFEGEKVVSYIHPGARVGVLVAFAGANGTDLTQVGRDVAMQVASMSPIAVDKDGVDPSLVQKEIEIGKEQARAEGKPEAMLEKIAVGKLNKFYKERTLLMQEFVKDPSRTIADHLAAADPKLKVTAFRRMHLGGEN